MCLFVYLVTDSNLPEIEWQKAQPTFNVVRLKRKEKFLDSLQGTNAYMLGSYEGCACGFMLEDSVDPEDRVASQASLEKLSQYVADALGREGRLFLFAAWDGDERKEPAKAKVRPPDLQRYPWGETWDRPHLIEVVASSS